MTNSGRTLLAILGVTLLVQVTSFVTPQQQQGATSFSLALNAKKNKRKNSSNKGFGKTSLEDAPKPNPIKDNIPMIPMDDGGMLKSVDGGSAKIPKVNENVPVEQRTAQILRDSYGLKTRAEQDAEIKRQEVEAEQRKKLADWKKAAEDGKEFDLLAYLPGPALIFIDQFLKVGVTVCTILFVLAGVGITFEAWSKASNSPLPEDIDNFIVNIIEPNFTPGLLVLLGFSVSLGAFAAAQLSSSSSVYREDR